MFHIYVAKLDRDVAYIAIVIHVCCNLLFSMFHISIYVATVFILDVAHVLHICCKCFI
jgi:hypothetical protein